MRLLVIAASPLRLRCAYRSPQILALLRHPRALGLLPSQRASCPFIDSAHSSAKPARSGPQITEAAFKSCLASCFYPPLHLKHVACFVFLWQTPSVSGARRASAPAQQSSAGRARNGGNEIIRDPHQEAARAMEKARQGPTEPIVVATPHAPRMNLRYGAVLSIAEHHPPPPRRRSIYL
jgi:hypothetical protein